MERLLGYDGAAGILYVKYYTYYNIIVAINLHSLTCNTRYINVTAIVLK
jgi:hypothetical protein